MRCDRSGYLCLSQQIPYAQAWQWQRQLVDAHKASLSDAYVAAEQASSLGDLPVKDTLLLLQHPPVYTLGQGADSRFVRFDPETAGYELHRIERGGEVTYHCPGQLVGYPILNLRHHQTDLHHYLRQLEEVIIRTLACYGLAAQRVTGMTGVWVQGRKLAAIGIKVSKWITMHGFALNVCPDLSGFEQIVPCGLEGKAVGAMAQFVPAVSVELVLPVLIEQFEAVFDLRLQTVSTADLGLSVGAEDGL